MESGSLALKVINSCHSERSEESALSHSENRFFVVPMKSGLLRMTFEVKLPSSLLYEQIYKAGSLRGALPLSKNSFPLPLVKGKGDKGGWG
jgi:hypothetical protein